MTIKLGKSTLDGTKGDPMGHETERNYNSSPKCYISTKPTNFYRLILVKGDEKRIRDV